MNQIEILFKDNNFVNDTIPSYKIDDSLKKTKCINQSQPQDNIADVDDVNNKLNQMSIINREAQSSLDNSKYKRKYEGNEGMPIKRQKQISESPQNNEQKSKIEEIDEQRVKEITEDKFNDEDAAQALMMLHDSSNQEGEIDNKNRINYSHILLPVALYNNGLYINSNQEQPPPPQPLIICKDFVDNKNFAYTEERPVKKDEKNGCKTNVNSAEVIEVSKIYLYIFDKKHVKEVRNYVKGDENDESNSNCPVKPIPQYLYKLNPIVENHSVEYGNTKETHKRRMKSTSNIHSRYTDGTDIKARDATPEEIEEYKEFILDSDKCDYCKIAMHKSELFKYEKKIMCINCAERFVKEGKIQYIMELRDYFEDNSINFDGMKLFKCNRLKHSRPITHFVKFQKMKNKSVITTNCSYCRLIKRVENLLKKVKKAKQL